jgi:threonine/homoserine/homoserine lactone efflux protein
MDALFKWLICIFVAIAVDIVWLYAGVGLKRATLRPQTERILNIALAAALLASVIPALL